MTELGVSLIETLILAVPESQRDLESLMRIWPQLEALVDEEKVFALGISDLNADQLAALHAESRVKPGVCQVNLDMCCVIPPELNEFAKENDIQLLTHSDPTDILPAESLKNMLATSLSERDSLNWSTCWVQRYSVIIKGRGIIKSKGYLASAARDWRKKP